MIRASRSRQYGIFIPKDQSFFTKTSYARSSSFSRSSFCSRVSGFFGVCFFFFLVIEGLYAEITGANVGVDLLMAIHISMRHQGKIHL